MKPVIAIDVDGVLADCYPVWSRHFSRLTCGKEHADWPEVVEWDCWKKLCKKCWDGCLHNPDVLYAHALRQNVLIVLSHLSTMAELHIVTSRHESVTEITKNWLFWTGVLQFITDVHLVQDKRAKCEEIGAIALIDDARTTSRRCKDRALK